MRLCNLPYLIQPFPDFLHVGLIGGASGLDPLGDLIDVPANGGQELVHLLDVPGVHIDDVSVNRHLPQVGADPLGLELGHLLFHQFLFLGGHIELHLDIPFPYLPSWYLASFRIRVWDVPNKHFSGLGGGFP